MEHYRTTTTTKERKEQEGARIVSIGPWNDSPSFPFPSPFPSPSDCPAQQNTLQHGQTVLGTRQQLMTDCTVHRTAVVTLGGSSLEAFLKPCESHVHYNSMLMLDTAK